MNNVSLPLYGIFFSVKIYVNFVGYIFTDEAIRRQKQLA